MSNTMIHLENICKTYGQGKNELHVLKDVSLHINQGEIISIMGPSGAGKSTLLNIIGCLDVSNSGTLTLNNETVSSFGVDQLAGFRNRYIGFIFQMHNLLPEFTALENVMMPLLIRRETKSSAQKKSITLIERFGLLERANHKPSEMSGGECQRISVARALVGEPAIIFADEPTGNLDSTNSQILADILLEEGRKRGTTIVIVTHDNSISAFTGRTVHLRDGKIESDEQRMEAVK